MAVSNLERGGSRTNAAFEHLKKRLSTDLTDIYFSDDIFYNYCAYCADMASVVMFATTSLSPVNLAVMRAYTPKPAPEYAAPGHRQRIAVAATAVDDTRVEYTEITGGLLHTSGQTTPSDFAGTAYRALAAHNCPYPPYDGSHPLDMSKFFSRRQSREDTRMNLSALLRCPNEPFRTLDIDLVVVDGLGRVRAIIEESANSTKNTQMSTVLATHVGVPVVKIITTDETTGAAEIRVSKTSNRRLNEPDTLFSSYDQFFDQWCVPALS